MARVGGVASVLAVVLYLTWRIGYTLPVGGWNRTVAWILVAFEALPWPGFS